MDLHVSVRERAAFERFTDSLFLLYILKGFKNNDEGITAYLNRLLIVWITYL